MMIKFGNKLNHMKYNFRNNSNCKEKQYIYFQPKKMQWEHLQNQLTI